MEGKLNKKIVVYFSFLLLGLFSGLFFYFNNSQTTQAQSGLSCSVVSGACSGTTVFKMYSRSDSHAELSNQSNYNYSVCCSGIAGLGNSCAGNYDTVLKLSSPTNAHVEKKTYSNYSNPACLSITDATVSCDYANDCSTLGADYTCLSSISGDTNAHVGDCNAYSTKVCCHLGEAHPWTCGDPITFTYKGSSVTYGTVSHNGKCWMDRNLGASRVATAYNDSSAYGDLFQWGRCDDGHQNRNSALYYTGSPVSSSACNAGNAWDGKFVTSTGNPYDWLSTHDDTLWQGVNGTNNPCPPGWRIPTETELETEMNSWSSQNSNGAYASPLKLPVGGSRECVNGEVGDVNSGNYWSSTMYDNNLYSYLLHFGYSEAIRSGSDKAIGHSVRCINDNGTTAPSVTTVSASSISSNQATLNGSLSDLGGAGSCNTWFQWGTTNSYGNETSHNIKSSTGSFSKTISGLTPGTTYHFRAVAENPGGIVHGGDKTFTTNMASWSSCGDPITFTYKGQTVTYGTVSYKGKCWMDRNLGASRVAGWKGDSAAYGDLFQWGRLDDGHQNRTSGVTTTLSNSDVPGHSNFIKTSSSPYNWRSPRNTSLWGGAGRINNPCPTGWRVPFKEEWETAMQDCNNSNCAFNSPLKLTIAGYRDVDGQVRFDSGIVASPGNEGFYWSSTVFSGYFFGAHDLWLYDYGADMHEDICGRGMSVRCIKDNVITAPTITNSTGASSVSANSAKLNGEITDTGGENPTVKIYWGDNDGGLNSANWDHTINLGTKSAETFFKDISGLNPNTDYYYRCYAENSGGSDWANSTASFHTSSLGSCQPHNVSGWAWAGAPQASGGEKLGLGWISFSCKNQGTGADYGVDIQTDGNLTGYAYYDMDDPNTSDKEVGWIDFNPSLSGKPGLPNKTATVDLDGSVCGTIGCVYGWARAVNHDSSWDGWIKLSKDASDSGSSYGTYIDTDTGKFHGWAWGDNVMGWMSFNCDNPESPNSCGATNNYHVQTSFSFVQKPTATNLRKDGSPIYCPTGNLCSGTKQKGHLALIWDYDGDNPQAEYTIQISTNPGFGGATSVTRTQAVPKGSTGNTAIDIVSSPTFSNLEIGYNDTYYFRVKVKDNTGLESVSWSNTASVTTKQHPYPWVCFHYDPVEPVAGEPVNFTDDSEVYGGTSKSSILWTFEDGNPASASGSTATSTFSAGSGKTIKLTIKDSTGFQCTKERKIDISLPMPGWSEE